jgi:hypothetical protein
VISSHKCTILVFPFSQLNDLLSPHVSALHELSTINPANTTIGESVKDTLSKLYRLQVLADQLMTTHKQADELKKLRELNEYDYQSLLRLLNQQQEGLNEALRLKMTIYREMYSCCHEVGRIKKVQSKQTNKIDFRNEVQLDKQLTKYQNTLSVKFRELNQLLWQLGEPIHHPTYLQAHLMGSMEIYNMLEIERDLQLSFAGYDISPKLKRTQESTEAYLQRRCIDAAGLVKKMGGVGRFNTFLMLSESECLRLVDDGYAGLIAEDQKTLESKLTPVEDKRILRDKILRIQTHFETSARSYTKLGSTEARPKNYDEILLEASTLSYEEMKARLKSLIPFSAEGRPEFNDGLLTDQFDLDYAINHTGFLQVFQEKYDRLTNLRLRMNRVEELQERELRNEEAKVADKESMRQEIITELATNPKTRRLYKTYDKIYEKRELVAVAYVKRPTVNLGNSFNYNDEFFCSGCNVVISKGLHQQVRRLDKEYFCDSCNRILVPFTHITYVKEEVDPLLISEEERIDMEERGDLGHIPACSNCGDELYENKELRVEVTPSLSYSTPCMSCYSFIVPLSLGEDILFIGDKTIKDHASAPEEEA